APRIRVTSLIDSKLTAGTAADKGAVERKAKTPPATHPARSHRARGRGYQGAAAVPRRPPYQAGDAALGRGVEAADRGDRGRVGDLRGQGPHREDEAEAGVLGGRIVGLGHGRPRGAGVGGGGRAEDGVGGDVVGRRGGRPARGPRRQAWAGASGF